MASELGCNPDPHLAELRRHYGDAYDVTYPRDGLWLAVRRDDHGTLKARTPFDLLDLIRADYAARPVPVPRPRARRAPVR